VAGSGVAQMEGVSKRYGGRFPWQRGVWALRDVSFSLPAGRVLGVLGPNRAGKTTLVKVLLSLCRADRGAVLRLGRPCADRSTLSRVGYLHESQAFPRYLSARELLTYYGALSGVGRYTLARRVNELLERVGLADRAVEPIGRYSKGMLQRLALAQALVNDPALLVLDEPSEGMDLLARRMLHEVVRQRRAAGQAVLLVSHSVPDVVELCDLALVLRAGRVVFLGTREELLAKSGDQRPTAAPPSASAETACCGPVWSAAKPAAAGVAPVQALSAALEQLYLETVP